MRSPSGLRLPGQRRNIRLMPNLATCQGILRRLIAKGDPNAISLAERAINEYWDVTLERGRKSGLRLIQLDVLEQRNAVIGAQHDFAQTVNDYIEKKLRGE
ncbi:hypothetical protein ABIB99_008284 [Bradyrhizobium sp. LA6.1]|uniref:hypothetical protein n=1 Tax=Bradyrhizobium sp. LA6.1 TaxID=3156378 RepID=UPI0033962E75